ncbi:replication-relaxation family protein [Comamonas antarctica]|uniref:replication-relaxation family protein n=1 Tax=Comamonas antarctica TaxID=2743470 RepID=UPI0028EA257F|nr:replication-relaxation family protein [Comamonas antarctica]
MNKKEQGSTYRVNTLQLLSAVGYASTRQVARRVWGRCDEPARRMASRTLRWLLVHRLVVAKRDGVGVNKANNELLFALTQLGVDEARRHGPGLVSNKKHARDYLRHSHDHRTACNSVYAALPYIDCWSELEVRTGECPISSFHYSVDGMAYSKIPDLIAIDEDGCYEWLEVENSWRSEKDLMKVVDCMRAMFSRESSDIKRMHFVVTVAGARTIGQRLKKRLTHENDSGWSAPVRMLDARIIAQHVRVSVLDAQTLTLHGVPI